MNGNYTVTLNITDSIGQSTSQDFAIDVSGAKKKVNIAPIIFLLGDGDK